jgi:ATP-binding cassette subfamily B (MDR/TAP) protein 1
MGAKRAAGLGDAQDDTQSQANILAGDAIMNYRTVASFAHEEKLVGDFRNLLAAPIGKVVRASHWTGIVYGLSQFTIYAQISAFFYGGAVLMKHFPDETPLNMFISIFAMNFGALAAG